MLRTSRFQEVLVPLLQLCPILASGLNLGCMFGGSCLLDSRVLAVELGHPFEHLVCEFPNWFYFRGVKGYWEHLTTSTTVPT